MKLPRRTLLHLAASAAALPAASWFAWADAYPSRPVHIVSAFAAGGPNDIVARVIGQWLSERFGQPFVIDNRPGSGGNLGSEVVARAHADGYTLLLASSSVAVNASLYDKLNFNFTRDMTAVASIMRVPNVMVVNPSVPAKTVSEFIVHAKANPGKINMATSGVGTITHIAGELFKAMTGVDLVAVHYRGGEPALIDLLAGRVQVMFEPLISTREYIGAGKLSALAVTTSARSDLLPDIPALAESVKGYEASQWYGVSGPKNLPASTVEKLGNEINAGLVDPKMKARLAELGGQPSPMNSAQFAEFVQAETTKWRKVIRAANIKLE
jgi:tripartite-type tricarboxylate transporter receptor subunit TctC